jgi:hypothetical protein
MSFTDSLPNHFTGARRLTLTMLTARDRADDFKGLPAGTAKPLRLLAAFQEAEPYLGLPTHAFKLVSWLVKQTMPCDWEECEWRSGQIPNTATGVGHPEDWGSP